MTTDSQEYHDVVDFAKETVGDHLRAVDYFDPGTHETLYIRDDVSALYSDQEFEQMRFERVTNLLNIGFFEELYNVGTFRYSIRRFDDASLIYLPLRESSGLVVSIDVESAIPLQDVGDGCCDLLRSDP